MDKKNILIVSRAFYPIIAPRSFRATELAIEFAKQGHNVKVITHMRDFDYTEFSLKHNIIIDDFVFGRWAEIKGRNLASRILRFLLLYLIMFPDIQIVRKLYKKLKFESGWDLLISIAVPYPVHWGVAIARIFNKSLTKVWVADCGDPFMGNRESKLNNPFYFHFIENWFCNKPDYLSVPIEEALDAYPLKCRHKIKIIPQGFNFETIKIISSKDKNNSRISFAFAGTLTAGIRDPRPFLDYILQLKHLDFEFNIYTNNFTFIENYVPMFEGKLKVLDFVPRDQLLLELSSMDFLVNFENRNSVQSPSKLIDYAILKKPILSIKHSSLDLSVINQFLNGDYSNSFIVKDVEKYNIKNVAKHFLSLN